jgi:hypothetical protein
MAPSARGSRQERGQIYKRSNSFVAIFSGLRNGDATHTVAHQNHRLSLRAGDFANAVGVTLKRDCRRSRFVISMPRQIRREDSVSPGFEQGHDLSPAPSSVPSAMNQQILRGHDQEHPIKNPTLPSFDTSGLQTGHLDESGISPG